MKRLDGYEIFWRAMRGNGIQHCRLQLTSLTNDESLELECLFVLSRKASISLLPLLHIPSKL